MRLESSGSGAPIGPMTPSPQRAARPMNTKNDLTVEYSPAKSHDEKWLPNQEPQGSLS
jgi:hypothetical protein